MSKTCVYLLHFSEPYKHAEHYLGFAKNESPQARLEQHRAGTGARLTQVVVAAGIALELVKTWPGKGRKFERQLKNRGSAKRICPKCRAAAKI